MSHFFHQVKLFTKFVIQEDNGQSHKHWLICVYLSSFHESRCSYINHIYKCTIIIQGSVILLFAFSDLNLWDILLLVVLLGWWVIFRIVLTQNLFNNTYIHDQLVTSLLSVCLLIIIYADVLKESCILWIQIVSLYSLFYMSQ